jgi:hypothetical protein
MEIETIKGVCALGPVTTHRVKRPQNKPALDCHKVLAFGVPIADGKERRIGQCIHCQKQMVRSPKKCGIDCVSCACGREDVPCVHRVVDLTPIAVRELKKATEQRRKGKKVNRKALKAKRKKGRR